VYYVTQTNVSPATFVLFINSERSISDTYMSYLRNTLRQKLGMDGMPIRFQFREKKRKS
jgi:GTP-binding protein